MKKDTNFKDEDAIFTDEEDSTKKNKTQSTKESKSDLFKKSIEDLNKKFGSRSIMFLGENTKSEETESISTGSLTLDYMTGIKGIPVGKITEIYGHEGSGKTTLALSLVAQAQKAGHNCLYIDMEHALNRTYANQLGVRVKELAINQPSSAEEALEIMDRIILSCSAQLIVVDSVSALLPQAEKDLSFGENLMAGQARFMSMCLRRIAPSANKCGCAIIFINQIRQKVGVMFGSNETTSGGMALKFYSSLRMEIRKKELIKDSSGKVTGQNLMVKIIKNKYGSPHTNSDIQLIYGKGFDKYSEMFELGVKFQFLQKKGSWYSVDGQMFAQGKDACVAKMKEDPKFCKRLLSFVDEKVKTDFDLAFGEEVVKSNIEENFEE